MKKLNEQNYKTTCFRQTYISRVLANQILEFSSNRKLVQSRPERQKCDFFSENLFLGALAILSAVSKSMGSLAFNKLGPGYFEIKGQNHQNKPADADTAGGLFWFVGDKESFPPFFFDVWWRQCYLDITRPFDCLQPAPTPISPHVSGWGR